MSQITSTRDESRDRVETRSSRDAPRSRRERREKGRSVPPRASERQAPRGGRGPRFVFVARAGDERRARGRRSRRGGRGELVAVPVAGRRQTAPAAPRPLALWACDGGGERAWAVVVARWIGELLPPEVSLTGSRLPQGTIVIARRVSRRAPPRRRVVSAAALCIPPRAATAGAGVRRAGSLARRVRAGGKWAPRSADAGTSRRRRRPLGVCVCRRGGALTSFGAGAALTRIMPGSSAWSACVDASIPERQNAHTFLHRPSTLYTRDAAHRAEDVPTTTSTGRHVSERSATKSRSARMCPTRTTATKTARATALSPASRPTRPRTCGT